MEAGRLRKPRLELGNLFILAVGFCGATWGSLQLLHVQTVAPTYVVLSLVLFTLPAAFLSAALILALEGAMAGQSRLRLLVPLVSIALAVGWRAILVVASDSRVAPVLLIMLVTASALSTRTRRALMAGVVLLVFFVGVWQANYAALWLSRDRLLDQFGRSTDIWLYGRVGLDVRSYENVFPIVTGFLFRLLEQGYGFVIAELMLILFLISRDEDGAEQLPRVLVAVATCYLAGVAVYLLFPMSGPCLFYPDSIAPSAKESPTYAGMTQLLVEYDSVRHSGRAVTGFAYFIALPSLHAALATLMQLVASKRAVRGLLVLPLNILAVLATFLLGWHYVIDVPVGIALGALVHVLVTRDPPARILAFRGC